MRVCGSHCAAIILASTWVVLLTIGRASKNTVGLTALARLTTTPTPRPKAAPLGEFLDTSRHFRVNL